MTTRAVALAVLIGSAHPLAHTPPGRFDHWPSVPVLFLHEPLSAISEFCNGTEVAKKIADLGYTTEACSTTYRGGRSGEATLLLLQSVLTSAENRRKVVDFERGKDWAFTKDNKLKATGCIILLPPKGSVSAFQMDVDYHHEIAHCNGWTGNHEDALPNRKPPKKLSSIATSSFPTSGWITMGPESWVANTPSFFSFAVSGNAILTIDQNGRAKCVGDPVSPDEAKKSIGQYAPIYLAICNPPKEPN